ncbi:8eee59b7-58ef-4535-b08a-6c4fcde3bc0c [Sclerotinia trifoliorum]|uniref:8eee59b7-58ef-4535-b08a-6c4fcde3bc0c n=1 Tax=Sclerotinia trifoliorum TaxID=28548 RepID=A0A8H2VPS3_9HELO|nr:8eee59b7-58ef-4535-b08a-6c4fcde3bc0c [Sclerotinia trifoliorum]
MILHKHKICVGAGLIPEAENRLVPSNLHLENWMSFEPDIQQICINVPRTVALMNRDTLHVYSLLDLFLPTKSKPDYVAILS